MLYQHRSTSKTTGHPPPLALAGAGAGAGEAEATSTLKRGTTKKMKRNRPHQPRQ